MKKQPKNWLVFTGLAFQIGIVMYLMIFLGGWIQEKWEITYSWPTLVTSSIGLIMVLLILIKQGNRGWFCDCITTKILLKASVVDHLPVFTSYFSSRPIGIISSR